MVLKKNGQVIAKVAEKPRKAPANGIVMKNNIPIGMMKKKIKPKLPSRESMPDKVLKDSEIAQHIYNNMDEVGTFLYDDIIHKYADKHTFEMLMNELEARGIIEEDTILRGRVTEKGHPWIMEMSV